MIRSWNRLKLELDLLRAQLPDKAAMYVAWALPRRVALWAYIRVMAHATQGPHGSDHVEDITYRMAYDRWEAGPHPIPDDPLEEDYWRDSIVDPITPP